MHWIFILALGGAAFYVIKKVKKDREDLMRQAAEFDEEFAEIKRQVAEEKAKRGIK